MVFNSLEFFLFLPIVFCIYWFIIKKSLIAQNVFLLIASYFFYGCWDWRFLSLILLSTIVDYFVGIKIDGSDDKAIRKKWLYVSVIFNVGLLGFFKYCNFFVDSWIDMLSTFGYNIKSTWTLRILSLIHI